MDAYDNVYVVDSGRPHVRCDASVLVFTHLHSGTQNVKPARRISGCSTKLKSPTDIKVDSSGLIYVADTTETGSGVIWIFAAGTNGDKAPMGYYTSSGAVTGLGIVP